MRKSKRNTIFIIPFILSWDRSADYQRQTCLELARKFQVIAYMQRDANFFLKALMQQCVYPKHKNIRFYRPLYFIPLRRFSIIDEVNQVLSYKLFELFVLRRHSAVLWIFDPLFYAIARIHGGKTLYDCVDYHRGFYSSGKNEEISRLEDKLIKRVDYFFVNSYALFYRHKGLRRPDAIVPQGFDHNSFLRPLHRTLILPRKKKVVGFVGAIDERFDFQLVRALVSRNPTWMFVLWGPIQADDLADKHSLSVLLDTVQLNPNVLCGQSTNKREIPDIIRRFDVAIIPYNWQLDSVRFAFPMKLFEYLYQGKLVVSSPIEELKRFPKYVRFGKTIGQWEKFIKDLFAQQLNKSERREMRGLAVSNSWDMKIKKVLRHVMG